MYIKSFGGQKGGSVEPPRTPPAYGPATDLQKFLNCLLVFCFRFTNWRCIWSAFIQSCNYRCNLVIESKNCSQLTNISSRPVATLLLAMICRHCKYCYSSRYSTNFLTSTYVCEENEWQRISGKLWMHTLKWWDNMNYTWKIPNTKLVHPKTTKMR